HAVKAAEAAAAAEAEVSDAPKRPRSKSPHDDMPSCRSARNVRPCRAPARRSRSREQLPGDHVRGFEQLRAAANGDARHELTIGRRSVDNRQHASIAISWCTPP